MPLTSAEKRVYGITGLLLIAYLALAVLGHAYSALLWIGLVAPPAFLFLLAATLWRGRRGPADLAVEEEGRRR